MHAPRKPTDPAELEKWSQDVTNEVMLNLSEGVEPQLIIEHLITLGATPETARATVSVFREELAKSKTREYMFIGIFIFVVGVAVTGISYLLSPGDSFRVAVGAIIIGGGYFVYGLARFGLDTVVGMFSRRP